METRAACKKRQEDIKKYHILYSSCTDESTDPICWSLSNFGACQKKRRIESICTAQGIRRNLAQTLPEVPLQIIFKELCLEDLTSVQYVCRHWRTVARNKTLWKDKIWTLKNTDREDLKYKQQLVSMPMLQNVIIPEENMLHHNKLHRQNREIVQTLLLHQRDLRSLEALALKSNLILMLVKKFSNLQSICIVLCRKSAASMLSALETHCKHLSDLKFIHSEESWTETVTKTDTRTVINLLRNHLITLRNLDITYFQSFLSPENIAHILQLKVNQLEKLELSYTETDESEAFNVISQSTNLELTLHVWGVVLNWNVLKSIKSIKLYIFNIPVDRLFLDRLMSTDSLPNVESVVVNSFGNHSRFLKTFSYMFPCLRNLHLDCYIPAAYNDELAYLKNLPLLENISFSCASFLEGGGFLHLSNCPALKTLEIGRYSVYGNSLDALCLCSRLRHLKFNCISFENVEQVLKLIRSLPNLKTLTFIKFDVRSELISCSSFLAIESECNDRNITLHFNEKFGY